MLCIPSLDIKYSDYLLLLSVCLTRSQDANILLVGTYAAGG